MHSKCTPLITFTLTTAQIMNMAAYREENEYEEIEGDEDRHSNDLLSVNENNANRSQLTGKSQNSDLSDH